MYNYKFSGFIYQNLTLLLVLIMYVVFISVTFSQTFSDTCHYVKQVTVLYIIIMTLSVVGTGKLK